MRFVSCYNSEKKFDFLSNSWDNSAIHVQYYEQGKGGIHRGTEVKTITTIDRVISVMDFGRQEKQAEPGAEGRGQYVWVLPMNTSEPLFELSNYLRIMYIWTIPCKDKVFSFVSVLPYPVGRR